MPSDHISNTDYHEWVEGKDQGKKGTAGVCAKCGAEIRWPIDMVIIRGILMILGFALLVAFVAAWLIATVLAMVLIGTPA